MDIHDPFSCPQVEALVKRIASSGSTDTAEDDYSDLRREIDQLGAAGTQHVAEYLHTLLDQAFSKLSVEEAVQSFLQLVLCGDISPGARAAAFSRLAALTFKHPAYSRETNYMYRARALASLARDAYTQRLIVLNNWLFAALSQTDVRTAKELSEHIETMLRVCLQDDINKSPAFQEAIARFQTHKAKLLLLEVPSTATDAEWGRVLDSMCDLYEVAIKSQRRDPHRSLNFRIELAEQLAQSASRYRPSLKLLEKVLDEAYRRLDAHPCDSCHAYFFQVRAVSQLAKGEVLFNEDGVTAKLLWTAALQDAHEAAKIYSRIGHHFSEEAQAVAREVSLQLEVVMKPSRIFLSHKGADKERVKRFHRTLRLLGFEPWLDVEELFAGRPLHRGLLEGLQQSCACVFFITKEFKDESYLRAEIDYSIEEERKRPAEFRIITLRLDQEAMVPGMLQRFVFKNCDNDLDALFEILWALPIKVGTVHWPRVLRGSQSG